MARQQTLGPIDEVEWPSALDLHVVDPGPPVRIHGYAVADDLALHYGFVDTLLLSLTGELPSASVRRAMDISLVLAAPVCGADAPAHAAILARLTGSPTAHVGSIAAIALAERARALVSDHLALLDWLDAPHASFPAHLRQPRDSGDHATAADRSEAEIVAHLVQTLTAIGFSSPAFAQRPRLHAAITAVWHGCGLRAPAQLELLWMLSGLPTTMAEAMAHGPAQFRSYPVDTPRLRYRGPR